MRAMTEIDADAALIRELGGPSKLAETLELDKRGGAQRVQNWLTRGIPAHVKVKYPHLFLRRALADNATHQPQSMAQYGPVASENIAT